MLVDPQYNKEKKMEKKITEITVHYLTIRIKQKNYIMYNTIGILVNFPI